MLLRTIFIQKSQKQLKFRYLTGIMILIVGCGGEIDAAGIDAAGIDAAGTGPATDIASIDRTVGGVSLNFLIFSWSPRPKPQDLLYAMALTILLPICMN